MRLRILVVPVLLAALVACSSGGENRTGASASARSPVDLAPYLLEASDLPEGARPAEGQGGDLDANKVATFIPLLPDAFAAIRADLRAASAAGFVVGEADAEAAPSVFDGTLHQSIALDLGDAAGATRALDGVRASLQRYRVADLDVDAGDAAFGMETALGDLPHALWLGWRDGRVVVILRATPATVEADAERMRSIAAAIDARA